MKKGESGQTVVLVALMAAMLFGLAALAIDISREQCKAESLQTVADSAALAVLNTLHVTGSSSDASAKLNQVMADAPSGAALKNLTPDQNGDYNFTLNNDGSYTIGLSEPDNYLFAGALGYGSTTANKTATASLTLPPVFKYSIFSGSSTAGLDIEATNFTIAGSGIGGNGSVNLQTTPGSQYSPPSPVQDAGLVLPDYSSYLYQALQPGSSTISDANNHISGVTWVDGDVTITASHLTGDGVFYATGNINIDLSDLVPNSTNAQFTLNDVSGQNAVTLYSGGNINFYVDSDNKINQSNTYTEAFVYLYGLFYAPNGQIAISPADNDNNGDPVAESIDLVGSFVANSLSLPILDVLRVDPTLLKSDVASLKLAYLGVNPEKMKISGVTFSGVGQNLHMTITGQGFWDSDSSTGIANTGGAVTPPCTTDIDEFQFDDITNDWRGGYEEDPQGANAVPLIYSGWSDSEIDIDGFGYKKNRQGQPTEYGGDNGYWVANPGDDVTLTVWNPSLDEEISWSGTLPGGQVQTPTADPAGGTIWKDATVTLADATAGASIYYTTDGSDPVTSTTTQEGTAVTITGTPGAQVTVKAYAAETGYTDSATATFTYTIGVAAPTASPASGSTLPWQNPQVTLNDATPGATVYYTTDGSDPKTSGTAQQCTPGTTVTVPNSGYSVTIEAYAAETGYPDSATSTFVYHLGWGQGGGGDGW